MWRFLGEALASLLMMFAAFLVWKARAEEEVALSPAPQRAAQPAVLAQKPESAPESTPKSREAKRFNRADRNDDGRIVLAELLEPRRKSYAKLDNKRDGRLSFEEWAHTTIDKFHGADANRDGQLTRSEYATTAPKPRKKPASKC